MDKTLYLLKEEIIQVDYPTKTKYLYESDLNKEIVLLMESQDKDFMYISNRFGIIDPNVETEPYRIKLLNASTRKAWVILTAELINRICREKAKHTINLMFSGDNYQDLEETLRGYGYKIEQPMKHFRTKEAQLKWIYNTIQKNICERLSNPPE